MSVEIKSVLVSDPVDESCVKLLTSHGIQVTAKYKLPKDELIKELEVISSTKSVTSIKPSFGFLIYEGPVADDALLSSTNAIKQKNWIKPINKIITRLFSYFIVFRIIKL